MRLPNLECPKRSSDPPTQAAEPVNVKIPYHALAAYFSPRKANQALNTSKWMIGWYGIVYNCTHFRSQLLALQTNQTCGLYSAKLF